MHDLFPNYDFNALTWPDLVKSEPREGLEQNLTTYHDPEGGGLIKRGALRYQILVPSYTVMFAFFLVSPWAGCSWPSGSTARLSGSGPRRSPAVSLARQGAPCFLVSLLQGFFLLLAGKAVFGMSWGVEPELLIPVVVCTSVAAVGLAMLVASVARTETQVAVYGTLLVLVMGGVSGSLMPRNLMPEQMKRISLVTPHTSASMLTPSS